MIVTGESNSDTWKNLVKMIFYIFKFRCCLDLSTFNFENIRVNTVRTSYCQAFVLFC